MGKNKYGSAIFIGRCKELSIFEQMLSDQPNEKWILHVLGPGGIGKTQLLLRFIDRVKELKDAGKRIKLTDKLIDLYWTAHQRELGIFKSIAEQLQSELFRKFYETLDEYESILAEKSSPDLIHEHLIHTRTQFFADYGNIEAEQILLIFDTAELGGDTGKDFWKETLATLKDAHSGTMAIIAGRELIPELPNDSTRVLNVSGFNVDETDAYLSEHEIELTPKTVDRIRELSKGHPILVALTVDWLNYGYTVEELVSCGPDEFKRLMVRRVLQLRSPQDQAILAMAHLYRRFDEHILAYILDMQVEDAVKALESASKFTFVKYRPAFNGKSGSWLLHDEMRDMLNTYAWPEIDPVGDFRRERHLKIIGYYGHQLSRTRKNSMEWQNLSLERLFYWLDADLPAAFSYSHSMFANARERREADFMQAIARELESVKEKLSPEMKKEGVFRQAVLDHLRGNFVKSIIAMNGLLEPEPFSEKAPRQASLRSQLVESYVYDGDLKNAIELGEQWSHWFEQSLKRLDKSVPQYKLVEFEYGKLLNNIGIAYGNQNKIESTISNYRKALIHFEAANAFAEVANTKNNLGFRLHRLGRDDEALAECKTALSIRQLFESPDQLGYSYNVMAIIYADQLDQNKALGYFRSALDAFDRANSSRGRGLVYIAYGRALRQRGRHEEKQEEESGTAQREDYIKAGEMLSSAEQIFRHLGDEASLSEALNERGTLLRQQRRWSEAIDCFAESQDLADKIGNQYRKVDNLVDISITYDYQPEPDLALKCALEASQMALDKVSNLNAYNLFAKAQQVVANVTFNRQEYNRAFDAVANACVYIMRLDPEKLGESAAKRGLYYTDMLEWAEDKIMNLPTQALVEEKTAFLIARWEDEGLVERNAGFIIGMRDLVTRYVLTKETEK